jgi:hypothetical protein
VNKRIFLCVTVESLDLFKDKEGWEWKKSKLQYIGGRL